MTNTKRPACISSHISIFGVGGSLQPCTGGPPAAIRPRGAILVYGTDDFGFQFWSTTLQYSSRSPTSTVLSFTDFTYHLSVSWTDVVMAPTWRRLFDRAQSSFGLGCPRGWLAGLVSSLSTAQLLQLLEEWDKARQWDGAAGWIWLSGRRQVRAMSSSRVGPL